MLQVIEIFLNLLKGIRSAGKKKTQPQVYLQLDQDMLLLYYGRITLSFSSSVPGSNIFSVVSTNPWAR